MKLAIAMAAAATAATAASAQPAIIPDVIGSTIANMAASGQEHRCLSGELFPSDAELTATRFGAEATMAGYVAAAGASERVDAAPYFSRNRRRREWVAEGVAAPVEAVSDRIARAVSSGQARLGAPAALIRASDGATAQGLWEARASDDAVVGRYLVSFRRERSEWKITRMELLAASGSPPEIAQYCHSPGDVEAYLTMLDEREEARKRRLVEREERRLARARR